MAVNLARPLPREDSSLGQMVAPFSKGLANENGALSLESWAHSQSLGVERRVREEAWAASFLPVTSSRGSSSRIHRWLKEIRSCVCFRE